MSEDTLPVIPYTFGNFWLPPCLRFSASEIAVSGTNEGYGDGSIKYSRIESVKVKPSKYFRGWKVGPTMLTINEKEKPRLTEKSSSWEHLFSNTQSERLQCDLDSFKYHEWPMIFKLIRRHSPQAEFDDWATKIMNARDEREIQNLKI